MQRGVWLKFAAWFLCADVVLLVLIAAGYLYVAPIPSEILALVFTPLMLVGQFTTVALVFLLPVFLAALIWPRRWWMLSLATLLGSLMVAAVVLDVVVYQQYRIHIDASILQLAFGGAGSAIFVFAPGFYRKVAIIFAAIVALQALLAVMTARWSARPHRLRGFVVGAALFLALLAEHGIFAWADAAGYAPVLRQGDLVPLYYPIRWRPFFARLGITSEHVPGASASRGSFNYPTQPIVCSATKPPNILFLLIDSWRFDTLNDRVMPKVAAFARDSITFTQHYSGGSSTRAGIFSLMYGIPATYWHAALANRTPPVLIRALQEQGYRLGVFASAPLTSPEFSRTVFSSVPDLQTHARGEMPYERDEDINRSLLELLDSADSARPFLGWVFYDAPHSYDFPPDAELPFQPSWQEVDYLALGKDFDPTPFWNRYLNSVHYVDQLIGRVLDRLREKGLLESTIVLISGDHGQEFNESKRNFWGHNSSFNRYQTQVPLVVHWPGKAPSTNDYRTSHFDIPATLMTDALGCTTESQAFTVGRNLFSPGGRDLLLMSNFTEYAVVTRDRTLMIHPYRGLAVEDRDGFAVPGAQPDPALIRQALELKSRFLRTE